MGNGQQILNSKDKRHWLVLLVFSLLFGVFGGIINSSIGVFYSPVAEDLGILQGSFALHATITMVAFGVISLFIPNIIYRFGWKPSFIVAMLCAVVGTAGMAFTENLMMFYFLGAIRGIGTGFYGMVPVSMFINKWFHEKHGLALSIASGTSGIIGIIFAPFFAALIEKFDWRFAFIIMSVVIIFMSLPAIFIPYSLSPEDFDLLPYGFSDHIVKEDGKVENIHKNLTMNEIKASLIAMVLFSVLITTVIGLNQHFTSYGVSIGMSLQLSGYILSAVMLGNVAFKIILGPLSDRFGAMTATIFMLISNLISLFIFIFTDAPYTTIFAGFVYGSIFGIGSVATPILLRNFYGVSLTEKVFPLISFTASLGGAFSNTMVGYIFDFTGSYISAFWIGVSIQCINIILLLVAYRLSIRKTIG